MKVRSTTMNGLMKLYLEGELDHHAAKKVMNDIERCIDRDLPRDCILDLGGLTFMDSSGIAVILKTHRRMNEIGGRTSIDNAGGQPRRVIDAAGIERLIEITAAM